MRFVSYLVSLTLMCFCAMKATAQAVEQQGQKEGRAKEIWEGSFADGTPLTRKKLDEMLAAHREWLKTGKDKIFGNIWKVENWMTSDWEADQGRLVLKGAHLENANLQGADLWAAYLEGVHLENANLQGADLWGVNMEGAHLDNANLKGAHLRFASLEGAHLWLTNLQGTHLWETSLEGVLYEPKQGALPNIVALRTAIHLETLWFISSPHGLEELKHAFKNAGMRQQEREITHAIKRSEQENAWKKGDFLEPLLNSVFFDLPVGYGLYPGRALKILGALIPVFALLYGWAIWRPSRNFGIIYRIWPKERIEVTEDEAGMADDTKIERLNPKGWRIIIPHAFYFSLLSAFHIGWRDLNVGTWITRLQRRPYALQAEGWIRTVSGWQSLLSVYLLAMWALTYFGRPFE